MMAKLCIVIMAVALTAASLLTVRQQRLDTVYDLSRSIERAAAHDRQLQEVRIEIARFITPSAVRTLASGLGQFQPIPLEWCDPVITVLHASMTQDPESAASDGPLQEANGVGRDTAAQPHGRPLLGPAFDRDDATPEQTR